jgi:hypothetical protein
MACLLLDSYYRTLPGFCVLLQREWCHFGHKIEDRTGRLSQTETSPVFIQFLDCVWQVMRQSPTCFEFNESLLLFLATHVYSRWFPDFCCNCDWERTEMVAPETSIWSYIEAQQDTFLNPQSVARPAVTAEASADDLADGSGVSAATASGAAAVGGEQKAGDSATDDAAGESNKHDGGDTSVEEKLTFQCEKIVFWQTLFRGPLMEWSVVDDSSRKSVQASRPSGQQRPCQVTRFEASTENLRCLLAGNNPDQLVERAHERPGGRHRAGRSSGSPQFQRKRTRRRSVVDTLREESTAVVSGGGGGGGGVTGGAGDSAVAPQRPNACCSVQ